MFLTDPNEVTRVWASFPLEAVFYSESDAWDETNFVYDGYAFCDILNKAYKFVEDSIHSTFPNATDIWIENTGWYGDMSQFTPRADDGEIRQYEDFDCWLTSLQHQLAELGGYID